MDLEAIEKKVANAQHEQLALFDTLLNSKTAINMNLEAQNSQCKKIKELQLEIISAQNQTTNVWEASEKGNLAFLTQEINKLWFWEKNDFINDSSKGFTILALAASHNHLKCVKYLLDNKANPNISDKMGYVPLHWAAKNGNVKIGKLLLKNKASINPRGEYGRTPLDMAVRHHQVEFVKLLLKYGADINAQTTEAGGTSVLHETVMIQDVPMLITLIADSNLNVNLRDSKHKTPLYYAIVLGLSEFAAAIVGHSSFQWPEDVTDPNHISQLLRITPEQNSEQIKRFLNHYKGN
jgi:ankyrin repeat protein